MAGLRQYQIKAIVDSTFLKIQEKVTNLLDELRANFEPSREEKKILDDMVILKELCSKEKELREKICKLRDEINEYSKNKLNKTVLYTYRYPDDPDYIEEVSKEFITDQVRKNLPKIPTYEEIERNLTLATVMIGFNVQEWIDNYVSKVLEK